jgi:hypothetical protein
MGEISRANRRFERFLGLDPKRPRDDTMNLEERARFPPQSPVEVDESKGTPVCNMNYDPETERITFSKFTEEQKKELGLPPYQIKK